MSCLSLSVALWGAHPARSMLELRESLALATDRDVEITAVMPPGVPAESRPDGVCFAEAATFDVAAARNTAARASRGDLLMFAVATEPVATEFIRGATTLLDERSDLSFVTSWPDHVPSGNDERPRACNTAMLICRPWFVEIPIIMRRDLVRNLGWFDEELGGFEMIDLLLRARSRGFDGVVIENTALACVGWLGDDASSDPSAMAAHANAEKMLQRHRVVIESELSAIICGKERMVRQLDARYRRAYSCRAALIERIGRLDRECAALETRKRG